MPAYEIEDRSRRLPPTFAAGEWVLWEVRDDPIPHRAFAGRFPTEGAARAALAALREKAALRGE